MPRFRYSSVVWTLYRLLEHRHLASAPRNLTGTRFFFWVEKVFLHADDVACFTRGYGIRHCRSGLNLSPSIFEATTLPLIYETRFEAIVSSVERQLSMLYVSWLFRSFPVSIFPLFVKSLSQQLQFCSLHVCVCLHCSSLVTSTFLDVISPY